MKTCALIAALFLAPSAFAQSQIDFLQAGRDYTNLFYTGNANEIWQNLSPVMKGLFGEPNGLLGMRLQIRGEHGDETDVIDERIVLEGEFVLYQRKAKFEKNLAP